MKLHILVPQYKEPFDVIKPLLDSIALQQNVDFDEMDVIICKDGEPEENPYEVSEDNYTINGFGLSL